MGNYRREFSRIARRAVREAMSDIETLFEEAVDNGIGSEFVRDDLLSDIREDGPIFGRFRRTLTGAATRSILVAMDQGSTLGWAEVQGLTAAGPGLVSIADPDELEIANAAIEDDLLMRWVAVLVNTCDRCLPLHGKTMSVREWRERGLHPSTIHSGYLREGTCKCTFVPDEQADDSLVPSLKRVREKGSRVSARQIGQQSIEKSIAARNKASRSPAGRRLLRRLGRSGA